MKIDKTKPVPAPGGYIWKIEESLVPGFRFQIELWSTADKRRFLRDWSFVKNEKHIRKVSERMVRDWGYERARKACVSKYIGETRGE